MVAKLLEYYNLLYTTEALEDELLLIDNLGENDASLFAFNLFSGKCTRISPSIKKITGFDYGEYLSRGIVCLRKMIHPTDYSNLIASIFIYVTNIKEQNVNCSIYDNLEISPFRIKHRNGYWTEINLYFLYKRNFQDTLIGLIQKANSWKKEIKSNYNISLREKEVLELIGNGDSSKIIADKLNISESTVITHRKNLIQKLNSKNTAELIKEAVKARIID